MLLLAALLLVLSVVPVLASAGGDPTYLLEIGDIWNGYQYFGVTKDPETLQLKAMFSNYGLNSLEYLTVGDTLTALNQKLTVVSVELRFNVTGYREETVEAEDMRIPQSGFTLVHKGDSIFGTQSTLLPVSKIHFSVDPGDSYIEFLTGYRVPSGAEGQTVYDEYGNPIAEIWTFSMTEDSVLIWYQLIGIAQLASDGTQIFPNVRAIIPPHEGNISFTIYPAGTSVPPFVVLYTLTALGGSRYAVILHPTDAFA